MPGGARYSKERKKRFLQVLQQTGKVTVAAKASGFSLAGLYDHRRRNEAFRKAWARVLDERHLMRVEVAEDVLYDRGVNGWQEAVYHNGQVVGQRRRYCTTSLLKWLAAEKPSKWGDATRMEHSGALTTGASLVILPALEMPRQAIEVETVSDGKDQG